AFAKQDFQSNVGGAVKTEEQVRPSSLPFRESVEHKKDADDQKHMEAHLRPKQRGLECIEEQLNSGEPDASQKVFARMIQKQCKTGAGKVKRTGYQDQPGGGKIHCRC